MITTPKIPLTYSLVFAGWAICDNDVIAISRLRGNNLKTLDIPHCCILTIGDSDEDWAFSLGVTNEHFNNEVFPFYACYF